MRPAPMHRDLHGRRHLPCRQGKEGKSLPLDRAGGILSGFERPQVATDAGRGDWTGLPSPQPLCSLPHSTNGRRTRAARSGELADGRSLAVPDVAEQLRQIIAERLRRRRRLAVAALIGCAAVPLTASIVWKPPVLLLWNASASAPVGLYHVHNGEPLHRGDMVVAWTPEPVRTLAARRHYLPANVPLVRIWRNK